MTRFVSALVAAILLSAGLVAVSAETASATCPPVRYVPCEYVVTRATHAKTVKKGKRPTAVIVVRASGNVRMRGVLLITVKGPGVNRKYTLKYSAKAARFVGPKLRKKGTYRVTIVFTTKMNVKDSRTTYQVKVTR